MILSRAVPRSRRAALGVAIAAAALVAGCTAAAQPSPSSQPLPSTRPSASAQPGSATPGPTSARPSNLPIPTPRVVPVDPSASPIVGEVPRGIMAAVRADLAARTTAAAAAGAEVIRAEAVQWPDGSLGCRVPGEVYPQVITPGYWIVLSVDGTEHDYRVTDAGAIRPCDQPLKPNPGG